MRNGERGVIFLWVLVSFLLLAVLLVGAVQPASTVAKREKELELLFRGMAYVEAIRLYQTEHGGAFPTQFKHLIQPGPKKTHYIRKLYENPFDPEGKWIILGPGTTVVTVGEDGKPSFNASPLGQGGINQGGIGQGGVQANPGAAGVGQQGGAQGAAPGSKGAPMGEVLPFKIGGQDGQPILGVYCNRHEKAFGQLRGKMSYDEWFFSPLVIPPLAPASMTPPAAPQQPGSGLPGSKK